MRKRALILMLAASVCLTATGCAILYNDFRTPLPSLNVQPGTEARIHVGSSSCTSYVWMVTVGDCSVEAAMKNGNISKIHHVDADIKSYFLGIYTKFTTVVYGE
ncbi:MAG TPA: TRL-like family protein [Deltaproteobacteria bacterium]|nr:TRL-like family protein [Deltaproteobacteria bacterium]HPP81342.1 TRL-like family protein [Deltaproteobacteria bacterium]